MVRSLLIRGMLVGLLAGLLAFAVAYLLGEPQVQKAIDFEELMSARADRAPAAEIVSRGTQRTFGLLLGTVAVGVGLGGIFALVYAYAYGRISVVGARATATVMALVAFATITLVPFTKYPANPPGVGSGDTIDKRTLLFFAMVTITALAFVAASRIRSEARERLGSWNAVIAAAAVFVVLIAVAELILPAVREIPRAFPADVLYRFRIASLATNATLWLTIGLGFGAASERLLSPSPARAR